MATILDYYTYAKLAAAAYVILDGQPEPLSDRTIADLADDQGRLPITLAEQMFLLDPENNPNPWTIPTGGYYGNDPNGFAATVFRRGSETVLAIRGTEPTLSSLFLDIHVDLAEIGLLGTALTQVVSMVNYIQRLRAPVDAAVTQLQLDVSLGAPSDNPQDYIQATGPFGAPIYLYFTQTTTSGLGLVSPAESLVVTGHSLGGHLAGMAARLFPELIDDAYIYNSPGFDPTAVDSLGTFGDAIAVAQAARLGFRIGAEAALITDAQQLTDEVVNLINRQIGGVAASSFAGLNIHSLESEDLAPGDDADIVSGFLTGEQLAAQETVITTEANSHLIEPFMDSLALHATLHSLNNAVTPAEITSLYQAASIEIPDSQEKLLEALDRLFGGNAAASFASVQIHSFESENLAPGDDIDLVSGFLTGAQLAAQELSVTTEGKAIPDGEWNLIRDAVQRGQPTGSPRLSIK